MHDSSDHNFFASCPKGLESLLNKEIGAFSPPSMKEIPGGIFFSGSLELALKICLWSRTASRVFLTLSDFPAGDPDELYRQCRAFPWDEYMDADQTFAVSGNVFSSSINHSHFAALKVKDAIADHFREKSGKRPSVATEHPDLQFNIFINKNIASLRLDLSGDSLHKRGYRSGIVSAPMKENLAAAVLLFSRWQWISEEGGSLADLMCGSGTFPIEAAMIAGNIAPGLYREYFGFTAWKKFDKKIWQSLLEDAESKRRNGMDKIPPIFGFDLSEKAVEMARENAENAGLEDKIIFEKRKVEDSFKIETKPGLVVMNPPYGERMGVYRNSDPNQYNKFYESIGERLRQDFIGWEGAVFTGNPEASREIRLRPRKVRTLFNGALECRLLHYEIKPEIFYREDKNLPPEPLSEGAQMFKNRLQKNLKSIGKWARKNNIQCYRLYDADIPQYAVALDIYENFAHVQEYEAPKTIDEKTAKRRMREAMKVIHEVLDISENHIYLKIRRKQKGTSQYTHQDFRGEFHVIHEGNCRFLVNFTDYLDTGIFLDHRKTREMIQQMSSGKDFLNLFAYTGTASVHAAKGGAKSTTTVDMSNTYIDWAKKNMKLNGFHDDSHIFIHDDCLEWILDCNNKYDLIFLDPPTFSNSKRMDGVLDLQRDHVDLIKNTAKLLKKDGTIFFSNNFRNFKMDLESLSQFNIKNITVETLQKDFMDNPKIHNCWRISHLTE